MRDILISLYYAGKSNFDDLEILIDCQLQFPKFKSIRYISQGYYIKIM